VVIRRGNTELAIAYDSSANDLAQIRRPADVLWCSNSGSVRHMKSEIIQELGQTDLVLPPASARVWRLGGSIGHGSSHAIDPQ